MLPDWLTGRNKIGVLHGIFLFLLTMAGCYFGSVYVLFFAMFMVTDNPAWDMTVPVGILLVNLFSLPLYINTLRSIWRYLYNVCVTLLVTTISFYGAIQWTQSIHALRDTWELLIMTIIGIAIAVSGMVFSVRRSRG